MSVPNSSQTTTAQNDDLLQKMEKSSFYLNKSHIENEIQEIHDTMDVDISKIDCNKLIEIFDALKITNEEMSLFAGYNDSGNPFNNNLNTAKDKLKTVTSYIEGTSTGASAEAKRKLKLITHLLSEQNEKKEYDSTMILLYLASHGSVCNNQKETAINSAFALMTNNMQKYVKDTNLETLIYRLLRDFRYLQAEKLYKEYGSDNNNHVITYFINFMAKHIGVAPMVDENASEWSMKSGWRETCVKSFFEKYYRINDIVIFIEKMIDEKRIPFQKIVSFFEQKCPKNYESTEWLNKAIDINSGKINHLFLRWMLVEFKILEQTLLMEDTTINKFGIPKWLQQMTIHTHCQCHTNLNCDTQCNHNDDDDDDDNLEEEEIQTQKNNPTIENIIVQA